MTSESFRVCMRLIVGLLLVLFPWHIYSQNKGSSLSGNGEISLEMVAIPAGNFTMGCSFEQNSHCAYDEKPEHQVALKSYAIAKYEVTQKLWKEIMGTNPSRVVEDDLPVHNVSWDEVQIFILWLNQKTGMNYRLPTEAEWEYAARGGTRQGDFSFLYSGSNELSAVAWYYTNSGGKPHTVGTKQPNALGLYDMSGNVWEWCSDLYGMYSEIAQQNPTGGTDGIARVARGGCAEGHAESCRVSTRKNMYQGSKDVNTGFRLAMDYDLGSQTDDSSERSGMTSQTTNTNITDKTAPDKTDAETTTKQGQAATERTAADTAKVSIRALLAAEKEAEKAQKAADRRKKATERKAKLNALPHSVFFTLNTAYTSMPQWSFGFKIGTVKVVGWYFSAMTNFNYKGAFSDFQEKQHYVLSGISKTTYIGGQLGLVVRPCQLLSVHLGAGFGYRSLNFESNQGWYRLLKRSYYGPTASLGVMFHVWKLAFSIEATGMVYNLNKLNDMRYAIGARAGIGFSLPFKKNDKPKKERSEL